MPASPKKVLLVACHNSVVTYSFIPAYWSKLKCYVIFKEPTSRNSNLFATVFWQLFQIPAQKDGFCGSPELFLQCHGGSCCWVLSCPSELDTCWQLWLSSCCMLLSIVLSISISFHSPCASSPYSDSALYCLCPRSLFKQHPGGPAPCKVYREAVVTPRHLL